MRVGPLLLLLRTAHIQSTAPSHGIQIREQPPLPLWFLFNWNPETARRSGTQLAAERARRARPGLGLGSDGGGSGSCGGGSVTSSRSSTASSGGSRSSRRSRRSTTCSGGFRLGGGGALGSFTSLGGCASLGG